MAMIVSDDPLNVLFESNTHYHSLSLEFLELPEKTKMFSFLGKAAYYFESMKITLNAHKYGLSVDKFKTDKGLASMFKPTSISYDIDGKSFVASMESEKYPFFAV
jgi:hypothetical protein